MNIRYDIIEDILKDSCQGYQDLVKPSDAIDYLVEILKEETSKLKRTDIKIDVAANYRILRLSIYYKGIDFYWSPKYPTYFLIIGSDDHNFNNLMPCYNLMSFASGSKEIREYLVDLITDFIGWNRHE